MAETLVQAARDGNLQVVIAELDSGIGVNEANAFVWSSDCQKFVYQLLQGETALMGAAENGHEDIVDLLILRCADVNCSSNVSSTFYGWTFEFVAE